MINISFVLHKMLFTIQLKCWVSIVTKSIIHHITCWPLAMDEFKRYPPSLTSEEVDFMNLNLHLYSTKWTIVNYRYKPYVMPPSLSVGLCLDYLVILCIMLCSSWFMSLPGGSKARHSTDCSTPANILNVSKKRDTSFVSIHNE